MKVAVRYFSKTGHTKLIAITVANTLSVEACDISVPLEEEYDKVFIGSAVYAANVDDKIKEFLHDNRYKIKELYSFSTSTLIPTTFKYIQKICDEEGINLSSNSFSCKGSFGPFAKGHPNKDDIINASKWAENCVK